MEEVVGHNVILSGKCKANCLGTIAFIQNGGRV